MPSASLLTPAGRGAVAVIAVAGPGAAEAIAAQFRPVSRKPLSAAGPGRVFFGRWEHGGSEAEEVIVCRRAAEAWEVHCHGGQAAAAAILEGLARAGCQTLEWPAAALASGGDLVAAEARIALASASTPRTAAILLDQLRGSLRAAIQDLGAQLQRGDTASAAAGLQRLIARGTLGTRLSHPWRVVLAGRPNAGKSSLLNALLGFPRAIVADQPGTTRDVLTVRTAVDGWPVELSDTAGLRDAEDPLEQAGARAASRQLTEADLVVLVADASEPWTADDRSLHDAWPAALVVHAKVDRVDRAVGDRPAGLPTSAVTGAGLEALLAAIAQRLVPSAPEPGEAVPFTERQRDGLEQALRALARLAREEAAGWLNRVLGDERRIHETFLETTAFRGAHIR